MGSLARASLIAMLLASFICLAFQAETCYNSTLSWSSKNKRLNVNGVPFNLKGASWFGFETSNNVVHGLWSRDYKALLSFLSSNGFNAIRVPLYLDLVTNDATPNSINFGGMNTDLNGLSSLQVLDKIIKAAGDQGILVMLDMHSFTAGTFASDGLWYNGNHDEATMIAGWTKLANRYKNYWNVFAADLKNEPHHATWGTGNSATDWNTAATRIGNAVLSVAPHWLIFVEGTGNSPPCAQNCFWGEDLIGVRNDPITLSRSDQLVYSPHAYGPSVYNQPYFSASNFPNNMPDIWNDHWGFIPATTGKAVVIGEWGGLMTGATQVWLNAFVSYLKANQMTDQFFWCLNPNSGDTGGLLLDDWVTPSQAKLDLLKNLVSSPATFRYDTPTGKVCVNTGSSTPATTSPTTTTAAPTTTTTKPPTTQPPTTTAAPTTTTTKPPTTTSTTTTTAPPTTTTSQTTTTKPPTTTTTTPPTTLPTTTPATTSSSSYSIYNDSLNSAWTSSWSWQATVSNVASVGVSSSTAMKVVLAPYGGLQLGASTAGISWQGKYSKLQFSIKSVGTSINNLDVYWNSNTGKKITVAATIADYRTFSPYLVADLNAPGLLGNPGGLVFFNNGPQQVTFYLDRIILV